jgi:hypothetical protein
MPGKKETCSSKHDRNGSGSAKKKNSHRHAKRDHRISKLTFLVTFRMFSLRTCATINRHARPLWEGLDKSFDKDNHPPGLSSEIHSHPVFPALAEMT